MKEPLHLQYFNNKLVVRDEPTYSPYSVDNVRSYDIVHFLSDRREIVNQYGITLLDQSGTGHSCILLASGGGTAVHERSALIRENNLYVAIGSQLCALTLSDLSLLWNKQVDLVTCFGVLYSVEHNCLISHGELEISRVGLDGTAIWSKSGRDIITGELLLEPNQVKVTDWNDDLYVFAIGDGHLLVAPKP